MRPLAPAAVEDISPALRGALWMIAAATCFSVMITLVRLASRTLPVSEIAFFRNLFGLLVMVPWLVREGRRALATRRPWLHLLRGALALAAMLCWFYTLSVMPLAEATAFSFTAPVFATLLAVPVLGERLVPARIAAVALAFVGALVILRPGLRGLQPAALVALFTAVVWGTSTIVVKILARTESAAAIVTWMVLFTTPASLLLALPAWRTPGPDELLVLALLGAAGSAGHYCMSRALRLADAGFVAPFDYLRLPLVALFAWLVFGQRPDAWTWAGAALIAAGGILVARSGTRRGAPLT